MITKFNRLIELVRVALADCVDHTCPLSGRSREKTYTTVSGSNTKVNMCTFIKFCGKLIKKVVLSTTRYIIIRACGKAIKDTVRL